MNIKNVSTNNLIAELRDRGISPTLLITTADIDLVLTDKNDKRSEDNKIEFTDEEKKEILKSLDYDMLDKMIWHEIACGISEAYLKKINSNLFVSK